MKSALRKLIGDIRARGDDIANCLHPADTNISETKAKEIEELYDRQIKDMVKADSMMLPGWHTATDDPEEPIDLNKKRRKKRS